MKKHQLSEHIGNIDDRLVQQAEHIPNYVRQHRQKAVRRFSAIAAVIALMVCSFVVGAAAFAKEIYIEKEQELINIGNSGISLVLPDGWAGRYGYSTLDNGDIKVYSLIARDDAAMLDGTLFWIECIDGQYPLDYIYAQPGYTIATTDTHTYRLVLASDVRYDSQDKKITDEYTSLFKSVPQIKILLSDWLTKNSINSSNWVEGTVTVQYLGKPGADGQEVIQTVMLNAEDSGIISQMIKNQDYTIESASFYVDIVIITDGTSYHMNSETGQIFGTDGFSAVFSSETLQEMLKILKPK